MASSFSENVYAAVSCIPPGRVATYRDIARRIGYPRAVRAVGTALKRNPTLVTVPCHRVVKSDGSIGQYAGGVKKKMELLTREGVLVKKGRMDLKKYMWKN